MNIRDKIAGIIADVVIDSGEGVSREFDGYYVSKELAIEMANRGNRSRLAKAMGWTE